MYALVLVYRVINLRLYDNSKWATPRSGRRTQNFVHRMKGYIAGSLSNMFPTEKIGFGKVCGCPLLSVVFLLPTLAPLDTRDR